MYFTTSKVVKFSKTLDFMRVCGVCPKKENNSKITLIYYRVRGYEKPLKFALHINLYTPHSPQFYYPIDSYWLRFLN